MAISEQPHEISHNMVLYGQGFRGLLVDFPLKFLGDQRVRSLAGTASILMQHVEAKKRIVAHASLSNLDLPKRASDGYGAH